MKNYFFVLFVFTAFSSFAQTDYSAIRLKKDSDYKEANKYALEASKYVLSVPLDTNNANRQKALQFVMKWMEGTPDYSFGLDATIMEKVVADNTDLLGVYMLSMTQYVLENEANANDADLVKLNAIKIVIGYVEKPENKVSIPKPLKRLIEANKRGELEKAIK